MWRAPWTGWEIAWCSTVRMGGWLPGWPAWRSGSTNYTCNWPVSTYLGREDRPDVKIHNFKKMLLCQVKLGRCEDLIKPRKGRDGVWKILIELRGMFTSRHRAVRSSAAIDAFSNTTKCRQEKGIWRIYQVFFLQVNSGSGLAPEEGVFKAPKEGNYYFQFHGLVRKFNKTIRAGGITDGTD